AARAADAPAVILDLELAQLGGGEATAGRIHRPRCTHLHRNQPEAITTTPQRSGGWWVARSPRRGHRRPRRRFLASSRGSGPLSAHVAAALVGSPRARARARARLRRRGRR